MRRTIRERMAALLEKALPDYSFAPEDLHVTNPMHTHLEGTCRWWGWGHRREAPRGLVLLQVTSWDRMTDCVRQGIELTDYDSGCKEIHVIERKKA